MWGFHLAVQVVGGVHGIQDTQCGFKLFARKSAHALFYDLHLEVRHSVLFLILTYLRSVGRSTWSCSGWRSTGGYRLPRWP